jgi:hypothetical protein
MWRFRGEIQPMVLRFCRLTRHAEVATESALTSSAMPPNATRFMTNTLKRPAASRARADPIGADFLPTDPRRCDSSYARANRGHRGLIVPRKTN